VSVDISIYFYEIAWIDWRKLRKSYDSGDWDMIQIVWTHKMHYFLLIYFNNKPIHVSSRLAAHHQEDQLCINSNWYSHALCWLAAAGMLYGYITMHVQQNIKYDTNYEFSEHKCRTLPLYQHFRWNFAKFESIFM